MNELIVTKTIPVRCTVIDTDSKQIRSHTYEIKYGLKTEAQEGEDYTFRGPGFNFTLPWRDGLFFEL